MSAAEVTSATAALLGLSDKPAKASAGQVAGVTETGNAGDEMLEIAGRPEPVVAMPTVPGLEQMGTQGINPLFALTLLVCAALALGLGARELRRW